MGVLAGWRYRKPFWVQPDQLDANLTGFPLLVKFASDTAIAAHALSSGYDFRFTASDGTTLLPFERESYSSGTGRFWTKTNLDGTFGTTIYLYYGKADATDASAPATVFSGYSGVFHLNETSGSSAINSIGSNNGTFYGSLPNAATGVLGGCQYFNGNDSTTEYIHCGNIGATSTNITLSAWVKWDDIQSATPSIFAKRDSGCNWMLAKTSYSFSGSDTDLTFSFWASGYWRLWHTTTANLQADTWYYIVVTYDGSSNPKVYVNGVLQSGYWNTSQPWYAAGPVAMASGTDAVQVGGRMDAGEPDPHYGWIDEARIKVAIHSAAWAKFEYYNQSSADSELTFSAEEDLAARSHTSTGGVAWGGTAAHRLIRSHTSTGGLAWGGLASLERPTTARSHTSTGGLVWSGSASRPNVRSHQSAGGLAWGGGVVYPSPCDGPATVCSGQEFGALNVLQLTSDGSFGVDPDGIITPNLTAVRVGYRDGGGA